jgi:hypothetical protein
MKTKKCFAIPFKDLHHMWLPREKGKKPSTNPHGSQKQKHVKMKQWV